MFSVKMERANIEYVVDGSRVLAFVRGAVPDPCHSRDSGAIDPKPGRYEYAGYNNV